MSTLEAEVRLVIRKAGMGYVLDALVTIAAEDVFKLRAEGSRRAEDKESTPEQEGFARARLHTLIKCRDSLRDLNHG